MKKSGFVVTILFCIVTTFLFIACDDFSQYSNPKTEHIHSFYEYIETIPPSCASDGVEVRECETCGEKEERVIYALGHTHIDVLESATCESEGYEGIGCLHCDYLEIEHILEKLTHDYFSENAIDPDCENGSEKRFTCSLCNHTYVEEIPPLGHDYKHTYHAPTCENAGENIYICAICTHEYTEEIPALEHSFELIDEILPTCTQYGYKLFKCNKCKTEKIEYPDPIGHSYSHEIISPTCTNEGYTRHTCTTCKESYNSDDKDALDHDYKFEVFSPTCSEGGYTHVTCRACDYDSIEQITPPVAHDYEKGVCVYCGKQQTPLEFISIVEGISIITSKSAFTLNSALKEYELLSENDKNRQDVIQNFSLLDSYIIEFSTLFNNRLSALGNISTLKYDFLTASTRYATGSILYDEFNAALADSGTNLLYETSVMQAHYLRISEFIAEYERLENAPKLISTPISIIPLYSFGTSFLVPALPILVDEQNIYYYCEFYTGNTLMFTHTVSAGGDILELELNQLISAYCLMNDHDGLNVKYRALIYVEDANEHDYRLYTEFSEFSNVLYFGNIYFNNANLALNKTIHSEYDGQISPITELNDGSLLTSHYFYLSNNNGTLNAELSIVIDLGLILKFNKTAITFNENYAKTYRIEISLDGISYTSIGEYNGYSITCAEDLGANYVAQYIRFTCLTSISAIYTVCEIEIFCLQAKNYDTVYPD